VEEYATSTFNGAYKYGFNGINEISPFGEKKKKKKNPQDTTIIM